MCPFTGGGNHWGPDIVPTPLSHRCGAWHGHSMERHRLSPITPAGACYGTHNTCAGRCGDRELSFRDATSMYPLVAPSQPLIRLLGFYCFWSHQATSLSLLLGLMSSDVFSGSSWFGVTSHLLPAFYWIDSHQMSYDNFLGVESRDTFLQSSSGSGG